mgnify:CR=1 FL=1
MSMMKAARLHAIGDFRCDEVPVPVPTGKQLLVKVSACGICGSDIPRIFELGTSKQKYPLTLGHEFGGTVVAVGEEADPGLIGKRGAIFPCIPCMECDSCKVAEYVMCEDYDYLGSRSDGGMAEYCLVPSDWHFVETKNDETTDEALGMVEPCTVAQHAVRKGGVTAGHHVVIFGAGPIGLMASRWVKIFGAHPILVDVVDEKVQFGIDHGETVINSMKEDVVEAVRKMTGGHMADVVIEGTGTGPGLCNSIECARTMGTIVLMGNPHKDTVIRMKDHSSILRKELVLKGIWNSHYAETPINEWSFTVQMLDEGKLQVTDLITHRCDVEGLPQLCDDIFNRRVVICKAMYSAQKKKGGYRMLEKGAELLLSMDEYTDSWETVIEEFYKMIISDGYNGTPSGFENVCEDDNNVTKPYVLHAEANAITKLARSNNNSDGATIYITASPCIECAKLIIQAGIKRVVYGEKYRLTDGIELLRRAGVEVIYMDVDEEKSEKLLSSLPKEVIDLVGNEESNNDPIFRFLKREVAVAIKLLNKVRHDLEQLILIDRKSVV